MSGFPESAYGGATERPDLRSANVPCMFVAVFER